MRLKQYFEVVELLNQDISIAEITERTGVPAVQVAKIRSGSKPADYILFQYSGTETRCPICHSKTTLPCLLCFYKQHPDAESVDVIRRPLRNSSKACEILLDTELLGDDEDE